MPVTRLVKLVKVSDELQTQVQWKGHLAQDYTLELLQDVFEDVPNILERPPSRKNTPTHPAQQERSPLNLY